MAARFIALISPIIEHNFSKYIALKKAFYLTALEKVNGDYLEFGVFTGGALVFSTRVNRKLSWISGKMTTNFFGFDSFEGFGSAASHDDHPFYTDDTFAVNFQKVERNIKKQTKGSNVRLIKGFFNDTLIDHSPESYGISKARVIFIDCDLMEPALLALRFCAPLLQEGTILLLDDYFSYKGNSKLGISGAFMKFKNEHPEIEWRRLYGYGYLGQAFICTFPNS